MPANDEKHFCKPTDVQVSSETKFVYVSDGYCNSRIVVFDINGKFLKQFGLKQRMIVPHSLSLIEELDLICVADREKARILCFNAGIQDQNKLGEFKKELKPPFTYTGHHLYAIQNIGNLTLELTLELISTNHTLFFTGTHLFGVIRYDGGLLPPNTRGVLFDLTKDTNELVWQGDLSLNTPHDVTVDDDFNLYVSEIDEKASKLVKRFTTTNIVQKSESSKTPIQGNLQDDKPKSKRIDDTNMQEEDLKNLALTTAEPKNADAMSSSNAASDTDPKSKRSSLLLFLVFISSLLLISIILFVLKKRIGIEHYFRSLGLPTKVFYSKDLHINDPERCGFNLLREEEENLFDFELENNSSESEVEEFNFKHVRKV